MEGARVSPASAAGPVASDARARGGHEVRYYRESADLVPRIAEFVVAGLQDGGAVVVIATPKHIDLIDAELIRRSVDLDGARTAGTLVELDAIETIGRLMLAGRPDPYLFETVVGAAIETARGQAATPVVRAFSEMGGLLWVQGRESAAIALEQLWNRPLGHDPLTVLHAYPIDRMTETDVAAVSALHTAVAGAEDGGRIA